MLGGAVGRDKLGGYRRVRARRGTGRATLWRAQGDDAVVAGTAVSCCAGPYSSQSVTKVGWAWMQTSLERPGLSRLAINRLESRPLVGQHDTPTLSLMGIGEVSVNASGVTAI
jgi:hypothetical protein